MRNSLAALALFVLAVSLAPAETAEASGHNKENRQTRAHTIGADISRQFDTGMDADGSFSKSHFGFTFGIRQSFEKRFSLVLSGVYSLDRYEFRGSTGFASLYPWKDVESIRISAMVSRNIDERWMLFAAPSLRLSAEPGTLFDEAATGGVFVGFSYRKGERLRLGSGLAVLSQLEDDPKFLPLVFFDWTISDRLVLGMGRTGRGGGSGGVPGITVTWKPTSAWTQVLGVGYEKSRFRLKRGGTIPGGAGEDRAFEFFASVTYCLKPGVCLNFNGGVKFAGRLKLEDENGELVDKADYEMAPFAGLRLTGRF